MPNVNATNTVYRLVYSPGKNAVMEQMQASEWSTQYADYAVLAIRDATGDLYDISEWVAEMQIVHNELDKEGAGRDTKNGKMVRKYLATKHTLQVKILDKCPASVVKIIFDLVDTKPDDSKYSFAVRYQWPCGNELTEDMFYCSTVNFGAQRFSRQDKCCYYYGMNFNIIEM